MNQARQERNGLRPEYMAAFRSGLDICSSQTDHKSLPIKADRLFETFSLRVHPDP
jgi:hypothetical protein